VLAAVLPLLTRGARIPLCGLIAEYNDAGDRAPSPERSRGPNLRPLLVSRALIKGFIVSDHAERTAEFLREATAWWREGKLKYREDIVEGLEHAPTAFLKLFDGTNFGKLMVRVSNDPTA
jgi:NADPH-dependent curcumin reductase CurA